MASGSVRKALQTEILSIAQTALSTTIKTYDKKLVDQPLENYPYLVVNVRSKDQHPGEIGTLKELWAWEVQIYYLDIVDDYDTGEERRDDIVDKLETALELNYRLNSLTVTLNTAGNTERVYDSNFSSILFDSSGQEEYYTFVSELHLTVDMQRN